MNLSSASKHRRLGFQGLRSVISYLELNPTKTHLLAVKGPHGVRDLVVTPQRVRRVLAQLRKRLTSPRITGRDEISVLQTL